MKFTYTIEQGDTIIESIDEVKGISRFYFNEHCTRKEANK